jgi:Zn-dependent peptidase ImmA (M78 family)
MPTVNPAILKWAREKAGLSLDQAAAKLGFSNPARLEALEQGEQDPTRRQLVLMSEKYHRPLLTFYLPQPPRPANKGQDFRTLPQRRAPAAEALLDALLRDVLARQGLVRSALEEAEEDQPLAFVGSARMPNGLDRLVASMRKVLGVSLDEFRRQKSATDAFKVLRAGAERAGVFVLLAGNLGSFHTDIDAHVFRGFALADPVAPFVVVNENDSRSAWSFTLLHELAHVWLGETGVSGYEGDAEIERFCDAVAARFLLYPAELAEIRGNKDEDRDELKASIGIFASARNLSRKMVAYNLLQNNFITAATYRSLADEFDAERLRQKASDEAGGKANYYTVRRHRLGPGLLEFVRRMVAAGALSTTKAGRVLGVKPTAVGRLVDSSHAA